MPSKRIYSKKNRKAMKGGSGAAEYAQAVYGGPGQQHAAAGTNVIAANAQAAMSMRGGNATPNAATITGLSPAVIKGGKRGKKGGSLTSLAVPAVLLVANQMVTRRRRHSSYKKRRSFRRKH